MKRTERGRSHLCLLVECQEGHHGRSLARFRQEEIGAGEHSRRRKGLECLN